MRDNLCKVGEGSSPLSRGIPPAAATYRTFGGIIPALAGNTIEVIYCHYSPPDHPRSRGEYQHPHTAAARSLGSSPLSRGIRRPAKTWRYGARIIPALAGNTGFCTVTVIPPKDHPRSRGEYWSGRPAKILRLGSSPLSRGIPPRPCSSLGGPRIIPALAGNTHHPATAPRRPRDHPRSRGEYTAEGWPPRLYEGSSPLSRGIRTPGNG